MSEAARRKFRREGEERRRQDLIEATLDCVAEKGLKGATVRAIALRAGVTAGLIRHYFPGKEDLLQAAYSTLMGRMTEQAKAALDKYIQVSRACGPANYGSLAQGDLIQLVQTGKGMQAQAVIASFPNFDDPRKSAVVGKMGAAMLPRAAADGKPGVAIGSTTEKNMRIRPAPSTAPASSTSRGIWSKVTRSVHTQYGSASGASAMMMPGSEFSMSAFAKIR